MFRKHSKAIVWMLVVVMTYSPAMVYAAPTGEKQKIDLGYVTPETAAAVVLNPRHVLTAPEMEMLPTEVITAAGKKFLGIDPLQIDQVLVVAEITQGGPPGGGIVLHMASPVDPSKLFPELVPMTSEGQLNGKAYRKANGPMLMSIYCPDDNTVIVAHDAMLQKMLANHAAPKEGKMSKVLGHISNPPDALAIVQIEPIRPMINGMLMMAPVPPQLEDAKKLPDLLTSIGAKVNLTGDMSMSLSLKANDEAAAEQVEQILDKIMETAKQRAAAEIARMATSKDPVEAAMARYQKRLSEKMTGSLRPVRKGETLTLGTSGAKNPQAVQIATVGILIALLLPAVQAAREAARRAASQNNMKQILLAMHNTVQATKTFPPAYKADASGKPLLSWRVLILPFIEQDALYKQFHLDEPWDSPNNKPLIAKMPAVYRNPNSAVADQGKTNYLTVRNPKSVFADGKGVSPAQITDGFSNTIVLVEVPDAKAVEWTRPDDFQYNEDNPLKGLTGMRANGFLAGFADGSVHFIHSSIDQATLKALFTRNGGEPTGEF